MNIIKGQIKLVIWDLDETFWEGTLSEEGINYSQYNHDVVVQLAKRGVVSSICSKNAYSDVKCLLIKKNIWNYFVFPEIDWLPKGELVKKIICDMNLRAENVLFIDDNLSNLNEVEFFNEGISTCEPSIIGELLRSRFLIGKADLELTRLEQYRVLEKKRNERSTTFTCNQEFLKSSLIEVAISKAVISEIDRIHELVERTNQINFTKVRYSKDELVRDINSPGVECAYISVSDRFGSYGISGFYLIKSGKLIHFLFSCRTMNMGIESWLYNFIGKPELCVVGSTAVKLDTDLDYSYITLVDKITAQRVDASFSSSCLLLIGGCDLDQAVHYLSYPNIETDFNYVNQHGLSVHKEHTSLIRQLCFEDINYDEVLNNIPILGRSDIKYKLMTSSWDVLVYSPLNDFSRGIYRHNRTGFLLPFDSFNINWSNEENWGNLPGHLRDVPKDFLINLRDNFSFLGPISAEDFKKNLQLLSSKFHKRKIIFLNGSEEKLMNCQYWEEGMHIRHSVMNKVLEEFCTEVGNVDVIDVRNLIDGEGDHLDNIRHYKKRIYMGIAKEISRLFNQESASDVRMKNVVFVNWLLLWRRVLSAVKRRIFSICI